MGVAVYTENLEKQVWLRCYVQYCTKKLHFAKVANLHSCTRVHSFYRVDELGKSQSWGALILHHRKQMIAVYSIYRVDELGKSRSWGAHILHHHRADDCSPVGGYHLIGPI